MTTIVGCGGRDFADRGLVYRALDIIRAELGVTRVAHGACGQDYDDPWESSRLRGADKLIEAWATERGLETSWYPVPWSRCKTKQERSNAARVRAEMMFTKEKPVLCVAFPGGGGTHMTLRVSQVFGVPTRYVPSMKAMEVSGE